MRPPAITIPSPVQEIDIPLFKEYGVTVFMKREDLIHPFISGNKWRKLKYNLATVNTGIVTYGGAFSNHLHATAAAGYLYGIPAVGIVRGELDEDNPTVKDCRKWGMQLHAVARSAYKDKEGAPAIQEILSRYPDHTLIPEGGSNALAHKGVMEIADEIQESYDCILLSAGTGATVRGLASALPEEKFLVISSMKGSSLAAEWHIEDYKNVSINADYHFGGFGKTDDDLIHFINVFYVETGIPLDPIYNGKVMYGLQDLIRQGTFAGRRLLVIHTGGLQGIKAYNYLARKKHKPEIQIPRNL